MDTEKRASVGFFVLYFLVLLFAAVWAQFPYVQERVDGPIAPFYVLLGCTFVYVGLRAYLVLGRSLSNRWDSLWVSADLAVVTGAVLLTGGMKSDAALMYFWPIATSAIHRQWLRTIAVGFAGAGLYVGATVCEGLDENDPEKLATRIFLMLVATALAAWYARTERVRVEEIATLREQVALADYRSGLSREMHDGIQHYLVRIATRLELARLGIRKDPTKAATMAVDERITARQANDELRYLVQRLRSPVLEEQGFIHALRAHLSMSAERSSIDASLDIEGTPSPLPPDVEHAAFRIVQEALTNAEKHAAASEIKARLRFELESFQCSIADNGSGFDPSEEQEKGGVGIVGMRERAEAVNGALQIRSRPGQGTEITLTVPLEALAPLEEAADGGD